MLMQRSAPAYTHELTTAFWDATEKYMRPDLAYHNVKHPRITEKIGNQLVRKSRGLGIPSDPLVVSLGSLAHDYSFQDALDKNEHSSKEARSIVLARELLQLGNAEPALIDAVSLAIAATEAGVPATTNEARIVRKADLANLEYHRSEMLRYTSAYAFEFTQLGENLPETWTEWAGFARDKLLQLTTGDDTVLTDVTGEPSPIALFSGVAFENIDLLKLPFEQVRAICAERIDPVSPSNPMGHYFDMLPWAK
jgi:predicted metal-dependent HD superfamily phosphohydrolase